MKPTDIYQRAIKRVFSNLYGVLPDEVDVSWSPDGDTITVHCAGKTFTHQIRDDNDQSPEFVSDKEDPITVRLTDEERRRLERAI
jgi:hypothetical protein